MFQMHHLPIVDDRFFQHGLFAYGGGLVVGFVLVAEVVEILLVSHGRTSVRRPVDFCAFCRLASVCASAAIEVPRLWQHAGARGGPV